MSELIALLDPPTGESMGAVPLVTRESDGAMKVRGLSHSRQRVITTAELNELLASQQAMQIDPVSVEFPESNLVAMWVGEGFSEAAERLGIPPPPTPRGTVTTPTGHAAVGASEEVFARLEAWVERAFRKVVDERNNALAVLMAQVLPQHALTQAALWFSAPSAESRRNELEWSLRLKKDAGQASDAAEIERQYQKVCDHPPWTSLKAVLMVSGRAGSNHTNAARTLAKGVGIGPAAFSFVSFGEYLTNEWLRAHRQTPSKADLQAYGQRLVQESPYRFAQQVLSQQKENRQVLIVDGVKHAVIKDAIDFILGKPLRHYRVEVPEAAVMQNLRRDVSPDLIPVVQAAPTERALEDLVPRIPDRIIYDGSSKLNTGEVKDASRWVHERLSEVG